MESLKNAVDLLRGKLTKKVKSDTAAESAEPTEDLVIVSDYAVAQGAQFKAPTGDEVHDRYHWLPRAEIAPKYRPETTNGKRPQFYVDKVVGMSPEIDDFFAKRFAVRGGYLTYEKEYVAFPQGRVEPELSAFLTAVAVEHRIALPADEFGKLNFNVSRYGAEIRQSVTTQSYYYQGRPYCLRVEPEKRQDTYQWYQISPVLAHYVGDEKIQCEDILLADHAYDQNRFVKDLQSSVTLNHEIPLIYSRTPRKLDLPDAGIERLH